MVCAGERQRQRLQRLQELLAGQQSRGGGALEQQHRRGGSVSSGSIENERTAVSKNTRSLSRHPAGRACENVAIMHEAAATASRYRAFLAATTAGSPSASTSGHSLNNTGSMLLDTTSQAETSGSSESSRPSRSKSYTRESSKRGGAEAAGDLFAQEDVRAVAAVPRPHFPHPCESIPLSGSPSTSNSEVRQQETDECTSATERQVKGLRVARSRQQLRRGDAGECGATADRDGPSLRNNAGGHLVESVTGLQVMREEGSASSDSESDDSLFSSPIATRGALDEHNPSAAPFSKDDKGRQPPALPTQPGKGYLEPSGDVTAGVSGILMRSVDGSSVDCSAEAIVASRLGQSLDSAKLELASFDTNATDGGFLLNCNTSALELLDRLDSRCGVIPSRQDSSRETASVLGSARAVCAVAESSRLLTHDTATRPDDGMTTRSVDETEIVEMFCLATTTSAGHGGSTVVGSVFRAWRAVVARATLLRDATEAAAAVNWRPVSCLARASPWQRSLALAVLRGWGGIAAQLKRKSRMLEAALREEHLRWVSLRALRAWTALLALRYDAELAANTLHRSLLSVRYFQAWRDVTEVALMFEAAVVADAREAVAHRTASRAWLTWRDAVLATAQLTAAAAVHARCCALRSTFRVWAVEFISLQRARARLKVGLVAVRCRMHRRLLSTALLVWSEATTQVFVCRADAVKLLQGSWARCVFRDWVVSTVEGRLERVAVAMRTASLLAAGWERWTTHWAREAACKAMLRHVQTALAARVLDVWAVETRACVEGRIRAMAAARLHRLSRLWAAFRMGCRASLQRAIRTHLADSYRTRLSVCRGLAAFVLYAHRKRRQSALRRHLVCRLAVASARVSLQGWRRCAEWAAYKRVAQRMSSLTALRRALVAWLSACRLCRLSTVADHRARMSRARRALWGWLREGKLSSRLRMVQLRRLLESGRAALCAWLHAARAAADGRAVLVAHAFECWAQHAARAADLSRRLVMFYTVSYDRTLRVAFAALRCARARRRTCELVRDGKARRLSRQATTRWALLRWRTRVMERVDACLSVMDFVLGVAVGGAAGAGHWFRDSREGKGCRDALLAWWSAATRLRCARDTAFRRHDTRMRKAVGNAFYAWCGFMLQSVNVLYRQHQLKQVMQDELVAVVHTLHSATAFAGRATLARCFFAWRHGIVGAAEVAFLHRLRCLGVEVLREWLKEAVRTRPLRRSQTRLTDLRTRIASLSEASADKEERPPLSPLREGRLGGHLPPKPRPKQGPQQQQQQSIPVHVFVNHAGYADAGVGAAYRGFGAVGESTATDEARAQVTNPVFTPRSSFEACLAPVEKIIGSKGETVCVPKSATSDAFRVNPVFDDAGDSEDDDDSSDGFNGGDSGPIDPLSCLWRPSHHTTSDMQKIGKDLSALSADSSPVRRSCDDFVEPSKHRGIKSCPHWVTNSLEQSDSNMDDSLSDEEWSLLCPVPQATRHTSRRNSLFFVGEG